MLGVALQYLLIVVCMRVISLCDCHCFTVICELSGDHSYHETLR